MPLKSTYGTLGGQSPKNTLLPREMVDFTGISGVSGFRNLVISIVIWIRFSLISFLLLFSFPLFSQDECLKKKTGDYCFCNKLEKQITVAYTPATNNSQ